MKKACDEKFKENAEKVDTQARKQFHGATRSAIKCMIGYNHHGSRDQKVEYELTIQ